MMYDVKSHKYWGTCTPCPIWINAPGNNRHFSICVAICYQPIVAW